MRRALSGSPPRAQGVVGWALTPYRASCGALDRAPGRTCPWLSSPDTEGRRGRAAAARRGDGCAGTAAPAGPDRGQSTRPDRTAPISTTLNLASSSLPGDPGIQRRNGLLFRGKLLHRSLARSAARAELHPPLAGRLTEAVPFAAPLAGLPYHRPARLPISLRARRFTVCKPGLAPLRASSLPTALPVRRMKA